MEIEVQRLKKNQLEDEGVFNWPIWEKEVSKFDWFYAETEYCYIIEGSAIITTETEQVIEIEKGDFVKFPRGLNCVWEVNEYIRKHYNFE